MTFHCPATLVLCLHLVPLIAAAGPAQVHEARQGPISIYTSLGPDSITFQTSLSTSTTPDATSTMPTTTTTITTTTTTTSTSRSATADTSQTGSASPSETSSATPQPSPSTSGIIFAVQNMTTCFPGLISWNYSGTEAELTLSVTNTDVNYDTFRIKARQSTINAAIQQDLVLINTTAGSWTWPSVNLTQGWYEIQGSTPSVRNDSAPFFISNGTNVACLTSQASSSPTSGSSALSGKSNLASIVGGVVGGVVGIVLIIIAGFCLWKRKRRNISGGGRKNRKWGSLKSTNSTLEPEGTGVQVTINHFHSHSDSTGAILSDDLVGTSGKHSTAATPGGSDEDITTSGEEKLVSPASTSSMSAFDALKTPLHHDRRTSTYSPQPPTFVTNEGTFPRSGPRRISNQSLEQQAQRIRSSMDGSIRRRSERISMPSLPSPGLSRIPPSPTVRQATEEYPLAPVSPTAVNRSISAGAVSMTTRRASRKPVPYYDPLLFEDTNADSVSTFTAGAESSHSHGTGTATMAYGTPPDLTHKASFGDGRPVHYLIPDMPPPPQDSD